MNFLHTLDLDYIYRYPVYSVQLGGPFVLTGDVEPEYPAGGNALGAPAMDARTAA